MPRAQLSAVPLRRFAVPGACEAAAQLLLMRSAAHLPGAMLPLLAQTTLAWSLFWRAVVLRVSPTRPQAGGAQFAADRLHHQLVFASVLLGAGELFGGCADRRGAGQGIAA